MQCFPEVTLALCDNNLPQKQKHNRTQYEHRTQHKTAAAIYRTCRVLSTSIFDESSLLLFNKTLFKAAYDKGIGSIQKWMSLVEVLAQLPESTLLRTLACRHQRPQSEQVTGLM